MAQATITTISDLNNYQQKTRLTAGYPAIAGHKFLYAAIGLAGEAGEVANKVKKIFRDDKAELTEDKKQAIITELGDTLWYLARVADDLGVTLEDVATQNISKLLDRQGRGAIGGSGDKR